MKKLKGFYKNNRVFVILMGIAIFCVAVIAIMFLYLIISQNSGDLYGNRLNGIETVEINKKKLTQLEEQILSNEIVEKASTRIKGKIIYINIYLKEGKIQDSKEIAIKTLEFFSEDELAFYDLSYSLNKSSKEPDPEYSIMGYKKNDNTVITWTKYSEQTL